MKGIGRKNTLVKYINNLKMGEQVFINSINLSLGAIDSLREFIQDGTLIPVEAELKKMVVEEAIPKFLDGTCICPQMTYTKAPDKTESALTYLGLSKGAQDFIRWSFGKFNKDFTIIKHTQDGKNHFLTLDLLDGSVAEASIVNNDGVLECKSIRKQK